MTARIFTMVFSLLLAFSSPVFAWNATGHMLVAKIAYNELNPDAKVEVDRLTAIFTDLYPTANDYQTASVWADDIRANDITAFSNWHYITIPIYASPSLPKITTDDHNIAWALSEAEKVLKTKKTNDIERAVALSFYLHFMGDVHQPLHCASQVTEQYPDGDKGGNSFPVNSKSYQNLHQLWDSGASLFPTIGRPLTAKGEVKLTELMEKVLEQGGDDSDVALSNLDIAKEGNKKASKYAYADITPNSVPSSEYLARTQQIASKQVVLAGKRLAAKLNCLLGKAPCPKIG